MSGAPGIMGYLANNAIKNNGKMVGIIPEFLDSIQITNKDLSKLVITETMHERKNMMYKKASAFTALPGDVGTIDEVIKILT